MGGSSGGGGGSSGAVSWPTYFETTHASMLNHGGAVSITKSITELLNEAITSAGGNPYSSASAFDPSLDISVSLNAIDAFNTTIRNVNHLAVWTGVVDTVNTKWSGTFEGVSDAAIDDAMTQHSADLQYELDTTILPKYRLGMRDLGAVNSSAFALGEALIYNKKLSEVSKVGVEIRLGNSKMAAEAIIRSVDSETEHYFKWLDFQRTAASLILESRRMAIVASKEFVDGEIEIAHADARWDIETYQYMSNVLAAGHGGTATPPSGRNPSALQSTLGGALSGAAAGAMVGNAVPGVGTAMGAGIGAILGAGASFL
jgi:hypothetical protein